MPALPLADRVTPLAATARHEPCVLLKLGEIVLKGKNRQRFERLLHDNIKRAVRDLGIPLRLWQRDGVIVLTVPAGPLARGDDRDRKSTRLNSSHVKISYAVFCLK